LSTKPENALGDDKLWERAENQLKEALKKCGRDWKLNPGDGAFYGPKIDIKVMDALEREHQLGTVQLDFNLPERFNLQYRHSDENEEKEQGEKTSSEEVDSNGKNQLKPGFSRPVMIHRAVLGSIERMLAILCEHTGGKWPFWLSPRQIKIIPISEKFVDFAEGICNRLVYEGYSAELDKSNVSLNKKVRNAQIAQFNFIAVVGEEEKTNGYVDLREREKGDRLVRIIRLLLFNRENLESMNFLNFSVH
jgi:threonyl-tRNA synthetase